MAKVIFQYNSQTIEIQCKISDTFNDICKSLINKVNIDEDKLIFLYGGNQINKELTFEKLANSMVLPKKEMNVLVYDLDKTFVNNNIKNDNEDEDLEIEIEEIKNKVNEILSKYLGDRKYVKNKISKWRDAIMNDCKSVLVNKKYKYFVHLMIYDKSNEKSNYKGFYGFHGDKKYNNSVKKFKNL